MTTKTQGMIQLGRKDTGIQYNRQSGALTFLVRGVTVFTATSTGISWSVNPEFSDDVLPATTNLYGLGSAAKAWAAGWFTNLFLGSTNAITAHAGGGQTDAVALTTGLNRITVCATAGDSVRLPAAVAGAVCVITNIGAAPAQVFGASTDTINLVATATGVPHPVGASRMYTCSVAGNWDTGGVAALPSGKYTAATNTADFTATGVQAAGAERTYLNLTGNIGAGRAITLPTAAEIVAAIPNAYVGQTYFLSISSTGTGNFAWTVTTNTGLTLVGTMTIAEYQRRDFLVTLTSLTAISIQSLGSSTIASAAV